MSQAWQLQLLVTILPPGLCSQPSYGSSGAPVLSLLAVAVLHSGPGAPGQDCSSTSLLLTRSQHPAPRGARPLSRCGPGQQGCWDVSSHFLLLGLGETPTPVHVSVHSGFSWWTPGPLVAPSVGGGVTLKHLLGTCEQQGSYVTAHVLWNCGTGTLSQKIGSWTGTVPRGGSSPSV